ncbi:MAG TPA: DNA-protecting protein DprA [Candidatus Omnitrophica bacterium]|nr:DNA-protecting protein DprA [Candidatus Omnitrophota bacterium]HCI45131.1 DNA-protecting protein DprA [Candidatus Omnitrophota bacterium]
MIESHALLTLNAVPGVGNATTRKLLEYYGSATKVLSLTENDLAADQAVSGKLAAAIAQFPKEQFLAKELALIAQHGVCVLTFHDEEYPESLREIADSPVVLYVKGRLPENLSLSIAVVGSRNASLYGNSIAGQWSARLAEAGFTIVSGMARGIDTAAHTGALKARGHTVAVLGCGLSTVYPPENEKLFAEIASGGAVISEFPMTMPPVAQNFPRRNRIISGLSMGVIVVEAAVKSGALITADFALEQGREVYAVPGKVDSPTSKGVHGLIKQGAKLVSCVEDILEDIHPQLLREFQGSVTPPERKDPVASGAMNATEQQVYGFISDRPVHIDHLIDRCGTDALRVTTVLSCLELKHLIKQLPGKLFVR